MSACFPCGNYVVAYNWKSSNATIPTSTERFGNSILESSGKKLECILKRVQVSADTLDKEVETKGCGYLCSLVHLMRVQTC